jgi:hypothetical protein
MQRTASHTTAASLSVRACVQESKIHMEVEPSLATFLCHTNVATGVFFKGFQKNQDWQVLLHHQFLW